MDTKVSTPGMRMYTAFSSDVGVSAMVEDHAGVIPSRRAGYDPGCGPFVGMGLSDAGKVPLSYVDGIFDGEHVYFAYSATEGLYLYVWNTTWNPDTASDDAVLKHYRVPVDMTAIVTAVGADANGMLVGSEAAIRAAAAANCGPAERLQFFSVGRTVGNQYGYTIYQNDPGSEYEGPSLRNGLVYVREAEQDITMQWPSGIFFRATLSAAAQAILADPGNSEYFTVPVSTATELYSPADNYMPFQRAVYDATDTELSVDHYVVKASFGAGNVFQSAYKSFQVLGLPDGPAESVLL